MITGILVAGVFLLAGCGFQSTESAETVTFALTAEEEEGQHLFEEETFDGNGRTCSSCHRDGSRSITAAEAQAIFDEDPDDALFQHDAADDFGAGLTSVCIVVDADAACETKKKKSRCKVKTKLGLTYECVTSFERFLTHGTIIVGIDLHPNVTVDALADKVFLPRGVPSTLNTPALDPILMFDGRAPTLQAQAADALTGHAEVSSVTDAQLDAISAFERTEFTDEALASFAAGGPAPELPPGNTASEQRGRLFFNAPDPQVGITREGFCTACHTGPMLNELGVALDFGAANDEIPGLAGFPGDRTSSALVSEVNTMGNPERVWTLVDEDGVVRSVTSPDIGIAATTGKWRDVNRFKIPSLWGTAQTPPYFHDNSAKTIEELVDHYANFVAPTFGIVLDLQDRADIAAYLKLL